MIRLYSILLATLLTACGGSFQYHAHTASELLAEPGFSWAVHATDHFRIYVLEGSEAEARVAELKAEAESSLHHLVGLMGHGPGDEPIHAFVLPSRSRLQELVGYRVNGVAFPESSVIVGVLFDRGSAATGRHELVHILASRWFDIGAMGGGFGSLALGEGLAVFSEDHWHGHDLHALTKHLRARGDGLSALAMLDFEERPAERILYPQAGSFVKYLHDRFGGELLFEFRDRQAKSDAPLFQEVFGVTLAEIEKGWDAAVRAADAGGIEYPT